MSSNRNIVLALIVASLGYFVDVFDIILFTAVRLPSLRSIGVDDSQIMSMGLHLLNLQLFGMLVGGIFWGVYGDKFGRRSVLFGSIIMYSLANILNAYVTSTTEYGILRFIAGVGLAGELGAGVTLVNELISIKKRGYTTMCVAAIGVFGGITGGLAGRYLSWQTAYIVGGIMGFILLIFRLSLRESEIFLKIKQSNILKGSLVQLFTTKKTLVKYIKCIFLGTSMWIFIALFITIAPELGKELGLTGDVSSAIGILYFNVGLGIGDILSSLLSQYVENRKKPMQYFLGFLFIVLIIFLNLKNSSSTLFYCMCLCLGLGAGYWAIFLAFTSEQFGTNLRATATISIPNFTRAMVIPASWILSHIKLNFGLVNSVVAIGLFFVTIAFFTLRTLPDSFSNSLDFIE